jgi:quinohemoprotein ethanol dehydrogenase
VDGRQYVSIAVGWGGVFGLMQRATDKQDHGRSHLCAGRQPPLPEVPAYPLGELISGVKYDPAHIPEGTKLYVSNCVFCHGVPGVDKGGNIPNLGYVPSGHREPGRLRLQGPLREEGHARLHRQAQRR